MFKINKGICATLRLDFIVLIQVCVCAHACFSVCMQGDLQRQTLYCFLQTVPEAEEDVGHGQ